MNYSIAIPIRNKITLLAVLNRLVQLAPIHRLSGQHRNDNHPMGRLKQPAMAIHLVLRLRRRMSLFQIAVPWFHILKLKQR